ncbi:MAG: hypothetical protein ACI8TQ_001361 [Planctomycetota bacterium]|jgi:uncharacterized protein (DUF1501 family)
MTFYSNRREFLGQTISLAGLSVIAQIPLSAMRNRGSGADAVKPDTLILLQLSGGNDGLSSVIPYADDAYASARKATRFTKDEVLSINDYVGLHPELQFMSDEYSEGRLSIVQGVGYPNPNRSHFKSMDIWHSASEDGRAVKSGWIGRVSEALMKAKVNSERVVHVGGSLPFSLHSNASPAVSFIEPESYRWLGNEAEMTDLAEEFGKQAKGGALDHLRGVMRDASASSRRIRDAAAGYETTVEYPNGRLASSLRTAAALVKSDLGCRVISLEQGGYDTHQNQRGTHSRQMSDLDRGLKAFREDLGESDARGRTVIAIFSEFGRRVVENASGGTDHGTAGPMFVMGDGASGGLHGKHPSLVERDGDDLIFTTDFRSVYATLIEKLFSLDSIPVLGASYEQLNLLG